MRQSRPLSLVSLKGVKKTGLWGGKCRETRHVWPGSHTYVLGAWKGPEAPPRGASGKFLELMKKTPKAIFKSARKIDYLYGQMLKKA